jgi:hypothetical protein
MYIYFSPNFILLLEGILEVGGRGDKGPLLYLRNLICEMHISNFFNVDHFIKKIKLHMAVNTELGFLSICPIGSILSEKSNKTQA